MRRESPFGPLILHHSEIEANLVDPRSIQIISLDRPRAFLYKRFLSDAECDFLVVRIY